MAGGSRYDGTALGPNGRGPIPHATIAVLTQPANTSTTPGSPLATIYTDSTLGTIAANPFQADVLGNFHFYADATLGPFTIQIYGSQVQTPYVLADQGLPGFPGSKVAFSVLNNIRLADQFAGADLGAKINAADADLGATVGEIWVIGGGTITTNVSISTNHTLRVFPGAYGGVGSITLAANTALIAENPRSTVLTMTLTNTHQVIIAGSNVVVRGLELVQTGSGTGNNIHCSGSYSQLRINGNECQSGYHAFYYALGGSNANSLWFTNNLITTCGRADSAVAILNLNGVVATPILSDVHVEDNIFSGSGASAGISASQIFCSTSSLGIRNAVYANNTVFNSLGGGLWGSGVDGFTFIGNHIYSPANEGIDAEFCQNISMVGNVIKSASGTAVTILGLTGGAVSTTSTTAVSAGTIATVTPVAMTNIVPLGQLYVDSAGTPETVQVLSVTATTFTAYFASAHSGTWNIVGAGTSSNIVSVSRNISINGNSVESSGSAFAGAVHVVNGTRVSVTGNTIHNPVYHGIQVGVSGGAGSHLYINDLVVVGNSISSDTLTASTVGIRFDNGGVAGQQEGIIVSGNSVNRFPLGIVLTGSSAEQSVCGLNNIRNCTTDYTTDASSLPSTSILVPYVTTNKNGLSFGGAKDTKIYRSAANELTTDGGLKLKRLFATQGTALVAGDFALSAGWGNTATVTAVVGTDQAWTITVTANGTGIGANPTITLTFKDGTWTNPPIQISKMIAGTGTMTTLADAGSATAWGITFLGTPSAGSTYIISGIAMGR